jgi:hypothetical protein
MIDGQCSVFRSPSTRPHRSPRRRDPNSRPGPRCRPGIQPCSGLPPSFLPPQPHPQLLEAPSAASRNTKSSSYPSLPIGTRAQPIPSTADQAPTSPRSPPPLAGSRASGPLRRLPPSGLLRPRKDQAASQILTPCSLCHRPDLPQVARSPSAGATMHCSKPVCNTWCQVAALVYLRIANRWLHDEKSLTSPSPISKQFYALDL